MRTFSVLAAILSVGLVAAGCDIQAGNGKFDIDFATGKATDTWSRTYKVAENGRFELINVNGRIIAEPTGGAELIVEGRRTAKGRSDESAKELLGQLEIREEVGDQRVRVESRPPRSSGFSSHEIEWTVKVPKGVIVDLRTTNGGVRLKDLSNEIYAKTTNGGVKAENIDPSTFEASAVNGGIELALSSPVEAGDSIDMETVNGGVSLELPQDSRATITARCVNGGVRVENIELQKHDEEASEHERRRRLNGTMNGGGGKVNMSTTNGGVQLSRSTPKSTT